MATAVAFWTSCIKAIQLCMSQPPTEQEIASFHTRIKHHLEKLDELPQAVLKRLTHNVQVCCLPLAKMDDPRMYDVLQEHIVLA